VRTEDLDPVRQDLFNAPRTDPRLHHYRCAASGYCNDIRWATPVLQADWRVDFSKKYRGAAVSKSQCRSRERVFQLMVSKTKSLIIWPKIADLKVISRTSAMQYKTGVKRNLREIANELGVAHVVEGTVQRAANRVRVSVQLIDARNDTHVWLRNMIGTWPMSSPFRVRLPKKLPISFRPSCRQRKRVQLTSAHVDLVAYDLYLRAKELIYDGDANPFRRKEDYFKAVQLLTKR